MIKNLSDYKGKALILTTQEEQIDTPFYTTMITEIKITIDMFHKIWPGYYPKKELSNQIGAGMGIDFLPNVKIEDVHGDEVKQSDGTVISPKTGLRCFKQGRRMRPDGSFQISDPQPYEFNWADRAELDFLSDQETGGKKYGSKLAKRKHILELKKFATQRAGTGSELAVIRNLTGMATSFKEADIKKGLIVVSQIIKSTEYVAIEARAKVENIRNGGLIADRVNNDIELLTGNNPDIKNDFDRPDTNQQKPEPPKVVNQTQPEPQITEEQKMDNLFLDSQVEMDLKNKLKDQMNAMQLNGLDKTIINKYVIAILNCKKGFDYILTCLTTIEEKFNYDPQRINELIPQL